MAVGDVIQSYLAFGHLNQELTVIPEDHWYQAFSMAG